MGTTEAQSHGEMLKSYCEERVVRQLGSETQRQSQRHQPKGIKSLNKENGTQGGAGPPCTHGDEF